VHYPTRCNTQSSAPEDGRDNRPKQVELIGIINKPLLLHLVDVYIIYINRARSNKYQTPVYIAPKYKFLGSQMKFRKSGKSALGAVGCTWLAPVSAKTNRIRPTSKRAHCICDSEDAKTTARLFFFILYYG
jgi:hypothetical protein